MSTSPFDDEDDEPGFFQKFRIPIIALVCIAIGGGVWFAFFNKAEKPKKKSSSVSLVTIMPPPPPPPPTPPPTPPPEQPEETKPEETKQEFVEETMPDAAPEPESAPEEAPMGTNLEGPGSDSFGLAKGGGGGMIGGLGKSGGGGGGSKYGLYAGQVQSRVAEALRTHKKTRSAKLSVKVRVWADATGRITRATISGTTGDPATDRAICDEILTGLTLQRPPPEGMPMPIVMRLTATRPN